MNLDTPLQLHSRLPYPARIKAQCSVRRAGMMLDVLARVANWDQLARIWEFVVGFFKFLWTLLRFLGGG